jgi:uncharacterized membrane protein
MNGNTYRFTDRGIEQAIGNLLRAGVLLAVAVVLVGECVLLVRHGAARTDLAVFRGEPANLRTLQGILAGVLSFQGGNIIQLGVIILIATPVARVAFSAAAFAVEHDRLYVVITLIVLAVLLFSLAGGRF